MNLFASLGLIGGSVALLLIVLAFALGILLFEIWMFIDLINNARIQNDRKLLWGIAMLFIHPLAAIAYYFTDHRATAV